MLHYFSLLIHIRLGLILVNCHLLDLSVNSSCSAPNWLVLLQFFVKALCHFLFLLEFLLFTLLDASHGLSFHVFFFLESELLRE